jgi:hypothetical protein
MFSFYLFISLKRSFDKMAFVDIMNWKLIHACSEFIKMISRYFGRNFWKLKVNENRLFICFFLNEEITDFSGKKL